MAIVGRAVSFKEMLYKYFLYYRVAAIIAVATGRFLLHGVFPVWIFLSMQAIL